MGNPASAMKSRVIESVTGKSASYTGLVIIDTRGMQDVSFLFETPAMTSGDTNNYMTPTVMGSDQRTGTFAAVPGLASTTKFTGSTVTEILPSAANAPGVVLPRFIRVDWAETGSVTSAALKSWIRYNRKRGSGAPGRGALQDSANLP